MTLIPCSRIASSIFGGVPESVITWSMSPNPQIRLKPLRPNFEESASTTVFVAEAIIARFRHASCRCVVESPYSGSMPSTPRKSLLQAKLSSIRTAYSLTTKPTNGG